MSTPTMAGAMQHTSSQVGWLKGIGPTCFFCEQPATHFKPDVRGRLWWCPPCDTTEVEPCTGIVTSTLGVA